MEFWNNVLQWLKDKCRHITPLEFRKEDILFGVLDKKKADDTLNFIILCCKQYIYKCRTSLQLPHLVCFKSWIKVQYNTEKYIAFKNCNWDIFNKRWILYTLFTTDTTIGQ